MAVSGGAPMCSKLWLLAPPLWASDGLICGVLGHSDSAASHASWNCCARNSASTWGWRASRKSRRSIALSCASGNEGAAACETITHMSGQAFDVIVVGSGPGGGMAAWRLAVAGLKVALLESGRHMQPGIDYGAHVNAYANLEPRLHEGYSSPIPSVFSDHFERNHFTGVGDRPDHGYLRALGGRSLCWAGHSLRFGPGDYKHWPIAYDEVAPYYGKAERVMGVHGFKDGLWNMPDGEFQKGVPLRCAERMLQRGTEVLKTRGRKMDFVAQRKAIPTEKHARPTCHYCGHCMAGCEIDSKYTSANTPIPLALKTGNLMLLLESTMTRILTKDARVTGIVYAG